MPRTSPRNTRDFLIRGLPIDVADKLKVAASLHRQPMKDYLKEVLSAHVRELKRKGINLSLPKRGQSANSAGGR